MSQVKLYLFGYPRIERDGKEVELDTRKAVALLAYLAVSGEEVSRDSLAALLWPDYDQSSARGALRRTLSVLNKAVGEGILDIERERVRILPGADLWQDVAEFEQGLLPSQSLEALARAAASYRDKFMSGFSLRDSNEFDDWQFLQSERLSRDLASVYERLASGYASQGNYETALKYAHNWLSLDTLREEAHRLVMLLYAYSGQRNTALRQYRECVRVLDQELGVAPLPETTSLYQTILENRLPKAEIKLPDPLPLNAEPSPHPFEPASQREAFPLVGREAEFKSLQDAYQRAQAGHLVILEGEAGIGKTRLAEEFLTGAEARGALVVRMRCYQGESTLAYGPFIGGLSILINHAAGLASLRKVPPLALAEAARLVPEVSNCFPGLPEPPPIDGPGAQGRFFESLRQVFAGVSGLPTGILFLDDVQWADTASLDFLAYLVRRLRQNGPLLLLVTWRGDSSAGSQRIAQILYDASRSGVLTRLALPRLERSAIDGLVRVMAARVVVPDGFSDRLFRETEGLPFFAVEFLASTLKGDRMDADWSLPTSVRDLLQARLLGVGEAARQLLSTAAVIGRSFDFLTLREVSGRSEFEAVTGLEELLSGGLVVEHGEPGEVAYDFTHEKLRAIVYEETSLARRRLLHRRVAEALAGPGETRRERGPLAGAIAYHFSMAGDSPSAAAYYRLAGDHARALYANVEAIAHYEAALAAASFDAAYLHEAIGDLHTLQADYQAGIASLETAAALCSSGCLARLERKLGNIYARQGDWELAESHYRASFENAKNGEPVEQAGNYADWSYVAYQLGRAEDARCLAGQALELAQSSGDQLALAQAHNNFGIIARREEALDEALHHLSESLALARSLNHPGGQVAALNNLALVYFDLHRLDRAVELSQEALKLCSQVGDRHREAAIFNHLADLYHTLGQPAEAMEYLKKAVVIFAEIGIETGDMKPEVWKLTEW